MDTRSPSGEKQSSVPLGSVFSLWISSAQEWTAWRKPHLPLSKSLLGPSVLRKELKRKPGTARHGPTCNKSVKKKKKEKKDPGTLWLLATPPHLHILPSSSGSSRISHGFVVASLPHCPHSKSGTILGVPLGLSSLTPRDLPRVYHMEFCNCETGRPSAPIFHLLEGLN